MRFELQFRDNRIGVVTEDDADFPNLWGRITYDESLARPTSEEQKRLVRFIELNRESIRLADIEDGQDVSVNLKAINRELATFSDFIETDDWLLVSETGTKLPILCPILRHDGGIVWRWNPRDSAD